MTHHLLVRALQELLDPSHNLDETLDRHFAPTYRQRTNGEWSDRDGFREHIAHLRAVVTQADVKVAAELSEATRDGASYAEQHRIGVTKIDETSAAFDVFVFARLDADGRFLELEELTHVIDGDEHDVALASARS